MKDLSWTHKVAWGRPNRKGDIREAKDDLEQGFKVHAMRLGQAGICEGQQRAQCAWSHKTRVESATTGER